MTQRNPMNDRYQGDVKLGKTRKSAASAKPKNKAASSVILKAPKKTEEEKRKEEKAKRREAANEQRRIDRKYYTPDTPRYKKLRRTWWIFLAIAGACTVGAWFTRELPTNWVSIGMIIAAYVFIILAFWIEFSKVRKERKEYQERMLLLEREEERNRAAAARAEARKRTNSRKPKTPAKAAAKRVTPKPAEEEEKPAEEPKKRGFFGSGFRLSKKEQAKDVAVDTEESVAANG